MSRSATLAGPTASRHTPAATQPRVPGRERGSSYKGGAPELRPRCSVLSLFRIDTVSAALLHVPERDLDQLGEAELLAAGELRDRLERTVLVLGRAVLVKVGRTVADEQGSEDIGDKPASDGPELDGDVNLRDAGVGLRPGHRLRLRQDVRPQGRPVLESGGDLRQGLLVSVGGRLSDLQAFVGERLCTKGPGHVLTGRDAEDVARLEVAKRQFGRGVRGDSGGQAAQRAR